MWALVALELARAAGWREAEEDLRAVLARMVGERAPWVVAIERLEVRNANAR